MSRRLGGYVRLVGRRDAPSATAVTGAAIRSDWTAMPRGHFVHSLLLVCAVALVWEPSLQRDVYINSEKLQELVLNVSDSITAKGTKQLSCDTPGFFVGGFQKSAVWSGNNRHIPAAPSVCDRPEVPGLELLAEYLPPEVTPVAVISVGCHMGAQVMKCNVEGDSFVEGFVDFFEPDGHDGLYIPDKGVTCCTPVLLLSSGNVWQLNPCHCNRASSRLDCPTGQFLRGFNGEAVIEGHSVPTEPAECCNICLGNVQYDMTNCDRLHSCNGNGVCIMGSCECYPDWAGETCSQSKEAYFQEPGTESSIWWLGGIGFVGAFFCLFATFWIIRRTEQEGNNNRSPNRGILNFINSYINDTGSVGSTDTVSQADVTDNDERRQVAENSQSSDKAAQTGDSESYQPLLQMHCCLCETHPVQVTLVPCGHSNLCRKCCRKLTNCPFCRKPIVRRQRLFLSV